MIGGIYPAYAQLSIELGNDTTVCDELLLDAGGNSGVTYLWNTGDTTQTLLVHTTGFYSVQVLSSSDTTFDTIYVQILATPLTPILPDTFICGEGLVQVYAYSGTGSTLLWYSDSFTSQPHAAGDTIKLILTGDTTLYYENVAVLEEGGGAINSVASVLGFNSNNKGIRFDVLRSCILNSVKVYPVGSPTFVIALQDQNGTELDTLLVEVPIGLDSVELHVDFYLTPGQGYRLVARNISGGGLGRLFPYNFYPFDVGESLSLTGMENGGNTSYFYFFDWQVLIPTCFGERKAIDIDLLPAPVVDLGTDTLLCGGSFTLDVFNVGASYLWSNGDTTQALTLTQSDTVSVIVSLGNCSVEDTIGVIIKSQPTLPVVNDTSVCGPTLLRLAGQSQPEEFLFWYTTATQTTPTAVGDTVRLLANADTTFFVEAVNGVELAGGVIDTVSSAFGFNSNVKGMQFDVFQPVLLRSVTVYPAGGLDFTISLRDISGNELDTTRVSIIGNPTSFEVEVNFFIPPGNGYSLVARNIVGGGLGRLFPYALYPFQIGEALTITGMENGGTASYFYFFDWQINLLDCYSGRGSFNISVLPAPIFDLGADTVLCGDNIILDATSPGSSYLWSTGDTTATLLVTQSDTVTVEAVLGACTLSDSIAVTIFPDLPIPSISDTIFCGPGRYQLAVDSFENATTLWYRAKEDTIPFAVGELVEVNIIDTTTFFTRYTLGLSQSAALDAVPLIGQGLNVSTKGLRFDVARPCILKSVDLYANSSSSMLVSLQNAAGDLLASRVVVHPGGGRFEGELGFSLSSGQNYVLLGEVITGQFRFNFPFNQGYPIKGDLITINSLENGSQSAYYYFYNWSVLESICFGPIDSVKATVRIPIAFPDSIYTCNPISLDATTPSAMHVWNTGDSSQVIDVFETGLYSVEIIGAEGCVAQDTVFVRIPTVDLGQDGILCGKILSSGYDSASLIIWNTGDTLPNIQIDTLGEYTVEVLEPRGCLLRDTIRVTGFDDFPTLEIGEDISACDSIILDAGNPTLAYQWSTGDTTRVITVRASGLYTVTGINGNDCATNDTIGVNITQTPNADFSVVANGLFVSFFSNVEGPASHFWDFGDGSTSLQFSPTHTYAMADTYLVRLIVSNECGADTLKQEVVVAEPTGIPDVSTPIFSVYPQPAKDYLVVVLPGHVPYQTSPSVSLFDAQGRRQHIPTIRWEPGGDLRCEGINLPQGLYYLRVKAGAWTGTRSVLITPLP
jgi:hypothetical protein